MRETYSWGRYPAVEQSSHAMYWRNEALPQAGTMLPYGQGRSYGDVCLNDGGIVVATSNLQRFIHFDDTKGILRAEAGVTLAQILSLIMPRGWFLPVTPGTKFVSLGGAVANDVHGKNHHRAGSFACHVSAFELLRSDGERLHCTPTQNSEWFQATVGGLGLTGLITWVELSLKPISGPYIDQRLVRFKNLADFLQLNEAMEQEAEYTVAWIDCLARGKQLGRGLYMAGNHAAGEVASITTRDEPSISMPMDAPAFLLNKFTVQAFNAVYYNKPRRAVTQVHYDGFFYPLDKIAHWNRMYGKRGFFQYQCVIPLVQAESALEKTLDTIAQSGQASFLSVLKKFGDNTAPGLLSFPRAGITLALDIANRGSKTRQLLRQLDDITMANNGAVYPAKDACMSAAAFAQYFPAWKTFSKYIDPHFSSSFWRRVSQTNG